MSCTEIQLDLESEAATSALARILAEMLPKRFVIGLSGPLGAGKTALVRAFLHSLAPGLRVPSPTFVLEQTYEVPDASHPKISHWDLYRLSDGCIPEELREALSSDGLVFVEWPERVPEVVISLDLQVRLELPQEQNATERRRCVLRQVSLPSGENSGLFERLRDKLLALAATGPSRGGQGVLVLDSGVDS